MVEDHVDLVKSQVALEAPAGVPHHLAHGVLEQGHPAEGFNLAPPERIVEAGSAIVNDNIVGP